MIHRATILAVTALLGSMAAPALAAPPAAAAAPAGGDIDPAALDRLRAAMRKLVDDGKRAGIAYGVYHHGKLVALDGYGLSDRVSKTAMTPDSIVRIFSMSRAVTTVAFLTLVEQGKVGLDDPVSKYLPEFATTPVLRSADGTSIDTVAQVRPITIRHLLTYTSGLGYPFEYPAGITVKQTELMGPTVTTEEGVRRTAKLPLFSQPGERWRYGLSGDVLGRVAEVVSGMPLDRFMRERLFDRIGMKDTAFWVPPAKIDRLAKAYGPVGTDSLGDVNATWQPEYGSFDRPNSFLSAGGGLATTTRDYLLFTRLLLGGGSVDGVRILKPETVRDMLTGHAPLQPGLSYRPNISFGYGLGVLDKDAPRPFGIKGHEATWGGLANTFFIVDTENDLSAVAMTQYFGPDADSFTDSFRAGVYGLIAR